MTALGGGISPPMRRRAAGALRLEEREEISRGIAAGQSMRLPRKRGRCRCLDTGAAAQALSPGHPWAVTMARCPEAGATVVAAADLRMAMTRVSRWLT